MKGVELGGLPNKNLVSVGDVIKGLKEMLRLKIDTEGQDEEMARV